VEIASFVLATAFLTIIYGAGLWDVIVGWLARPDLTITAIIASWADRCPICFVLVGIVLGHLFWPAHIGR
jgi:hypothetical protein